jgi:6-phosphogluconolactonase
MNNMKSKLLSILITLGLLGAWNARADDLSENDSSPGVLYTMDNATGGNNVLAFLRAEDGSLTPAGRVPTGGTGLGSGLSSEGSVLLSRDGGWLFTCNAGSDELSVFAVTPHGLRLTDKVASGGRQPLSLAQHHNLLYVLNAGGAAGDKDNVSGFLFAFGRLVPLPGSQRSLSADNTGPAQVAFTQDGEALVVTERTTSAIDTYQVSDDGLLSGHQMFASSGATPFGFAVGRRDLLFVSEAMASTISSYEVSEGGGLQTITASAATKQTAACWAALSPNGRFVYTANAGSGSISGFAVDREGNLTLLGTDGRTGVTGSGSHPTDMAFSGNGRFLYSLNNGNGTIGAFHVKADGSLDALPGLSGLPTISSGLAGH